MSYTPDNWVIIRITIDKPHYRVLGGWSGGYAQSDSWRMNSGIVRVSSGQDHYHFYGSSGSDYQCHKETYGLKVNNSHVWSALKERYGDRVELMPETTDWLNLDWLIK